MPTPQLAILRPLVNLWTAVAALDRSQNEVIALIEDGKLRYAWNIASRASGHREIRILTQSLVEFQSSQRLPPVPPDEEFQRVVKLIFPAVSYKNGVAASVCATTITKRFSAGSQHVLALADEGSLRFVKDAVRRRGPNGSPAIEFASVVQFLKQRRMV